MYFINLVKVGRILSSIPCVVIVIIANRFECFLEAEADALQRLSLFSAFHYGKFQTHTKVEHLLTPNDQFLLFFFHAFPNFLFLINLFLIGG